MTKLSSRRCVDIDLHSTTFDCYQVLKRRLIFESALDLYSMGGHFHIAEDAAGTPCSGITSTVELGFGQLHDIAERTLNVRLWGNAYDRSKSDHSVSRKGLENLGDKY